MHYVKAEILVDASGKPAMHVKEGIEWMPNTWAYQSLARANKWAKYLRQDTTFIRNVEVMPQSEEVSTP